MFIDRLARAQLAPLIIDALRGRGRALAFALALYWLFLLDLVDIPRKRK